MAPCDNLELPTIGKKCFEFCKTLSHNGLAFSFQLTYGDFSLSLDTSEIRPMPAQNQVKRKKKSPSQRRRDSRRRSNFLKKKYATNTSPSASLTDLDLEIPPLITQGSPVSVLRDALDINKTNSRQTTHPCHSSQHSSSPSPGHSDVHVSILQDSCSIMKGREEVQKVPPLKILIDKQKSPRYCIQQVDGACSFSEEDGDISFCEDNILQSDHDDDNWITQIEDESKIGPSSNCPNCDQSFSASHQCPNHDNILKSDHDDGNLIVQSDDDLTEGQLTCPLCDQPFTDQHECQKENLKKCQNLTEFTERCLMLLNKYPLLLAQHRRQRTEREPPKTD